MNQEDRKEITEIVGTGVELGFAKAMPPIVKQLNDHETRLQLQEREIENCGEDHTEMKEMQKAQAFTVSTVKDDVSTLKNDKVWVRVLAYALLSISLVILAWWLGAFK